MTTEVEGTASAGAATVTPAPARTAARGPARSRPVGRGIEGSPMRVGDPRCLPAGEGARTARSGQRPANTPDLGAVDVLAVVNLDDGHHDKLFLNAVEDPVAATASTVQAVQGLKQGLTDAVRVLGEGSVEEVENGCGDGLRKGVELATSGRSEANLVPHRRRAA